MDFRSDERGQPVVIGALLVFAILVLAFAGYQAFVVPQQNAEVEFQHSQTVQDDMVDLRVAVVRAAISGADTSTGVQLGTQYPSRLIALNPAPPAGTLRTTEPEDIVIDSPNQQDSTDICPGPGTTRSLVYSNEYNEFQNGQNLVYENTVTYSNFENDDTELVRTNQRLVDSKDGVIELIALEGEYSESGIDLVALDFIRGETRSEEVRNPEITLPTTIINEQTWEEEILGEEANVESFVPGESVKFSVTGTYEVRCTPVGINGAPQSGSSSILRSGSGGDSNGGNDGGQQTGNSLVIDPGTNAEAPTAVDIDGSGDYAAARFHLVNINQTEPITEIISLSYTTNANVDRIAEQDDGYPYDSVTTVQGETGEAILGETAIDPDTRYEFSGVADIREDDGTAAVYMNEFQRSQGGSGNFRSVDVEGETVVITIEYQQGGEVFEQTLEVQLSNSSTA